MFNSFLFIFVFSGEGYYGVLGQVQSLQFEQVFGVGVFVVGGYSDFRSEVFSFFNKLSSRVGVQIVWSGNGNFLLEYYIFLIYRFSVVDLKFSLMI